jgi:hypothetical protein
MAETLAGFEGMSRWLNRLYFSGADPEALGDAFGRLMLAFFRSSIPYDGRFHDVRLWADRPQRSVACVDRGVDDGVGDGIDLYARERLGGRLVAIGCRLVDPAQTLRARDIEGFLASSARDPFQARIVVTTTDRWSANAERAVENASVPVERLRLTDLTVAAFDWASIERLVEQPRLITRPASQTVTVEESFEWNLTLRRRHAVIESGETRLGHVGGQGDRSGPAWHGRRSIRPAGNPRREQPTRDQAWRAEAARSGYPYPQRMRRGEYEPSKRQLQIELLKLQD